MIYLIFSYINRLFFIITAGMIFISGCKKEYPDNPPADNAKPVFYFTGHVNGLPVQLQAGVNDYYMYSSFTQDSNMVYNFFGTLKQVNCLKCTNQIKFKINDYAPSAIIAPDIEYSFTKNYYPFQLVNASQAGSPAEFPVSFYSAPMANDTAQFCSWDFGDGTTGNLPFESHQYLHPGYYTVKHTITYANACTSIISNQITVGMADSARAMINIDNITGNSIRCTAHGNGTNLKYLWDWGDGTTGTKDTVSHTYAKPGIYKINLQVTDSVLGVAQVSKYIVTQNYPACATNFDFRPQSGLENPAALSNIVITWTDHLGVTYTSDRIEQPIGSYFKILNAEDYLDNENNEPTKKLHIQFSCKLSNGTGTVNITNGDAVIAVSYQK